MDEQAKWRLVYAEDLSPEQKLSMAGRQLARGIDPFSGEKSLPSALHAQLLELHQQASALPDPTNAWTHFYMKAHPLMGPWHASLSPSSAATSQPIPETTHTATLGPSRVPVSNRREHVNPIAGRIAPSKGQGSVEAQALYSAWRSFLDDNNISVTDISSAYNTVVPYIQLSDAQVRRVHQQLNDGKLDGSNPLSASSPRQFFTGITGHAEAFFNALETDRASRESKLSIPPETRATLLETIQTALTQRQESMAR